MKQSLEAMKKSGVLLALFAFFSVVFVVGTNTLTKETIAKNDELLLLKFINEIIPPNKYNNEPAKTTFTLKAQESGLEKDATLYLATQDKNPVAAVFEITTLRGYGIITLLVGINAKDHSLYGVRVVRHTETPGLGDKIETKKSDWILSFSGKSLENPKPSGWFVKKDGGEFDQFTGATITPRAVVNTVKSVLLYADEHINELFEKDNLQTTKEVASKGNH